MDTTVVTTPTPTPAPPSPASPAIADTTAASAPSGKRPTMAEAFAADAARHAPTSSPTPEAAATGQGESATPESATATTQPTTSAKVGPFSVEEHKTILDNARTKVREEVEAGWKPYEAIRQVSPEVMQSWFGIADRMARDPVGFAVEFIDGLQNDARYAPQLRSHAGRLLAAGRTNADPEPQPDREIVDGAGNVIGVQFADGGKAWAAWNARTELAKVRQEFAPLKADHDERQQATVRAAEEHRAIETAADHGVAEILDILELDAKAGAGNDALLSEVHKTMAEHPDWSARKCALSVRDTHVVSPRLHATATTQALDDLKTKAHASTVNPASAAIATTHRPTSFHDKSLKW